MRETGYRRTAAVDFPDVGEGTLPRTLPQDHMLRHAYRLAIRSIHVGSEQT